MWYLIVGIVIWLVVVSGRLWILLTGSVTERYLQGHYIIFSEPKSYLWILCEAFWQVVDAIIWPITIIIKTVRVTKIIIEWKNAHKFSRE